MLISGAAPAMARWLPSSAVAAQCHDESDDSSSAAGPLTPAQVAAWRSSGVVVLQPGLLPPALVEAVRRDASLSFDDPAGPALADDALAFPSTASAAANAVTLHPRLLGAAAQLLGVPPLSLRLTQSVSSFLLRVPWLIYSAVPA